MTAGGPTSDPAGSPVTGRAYPSSRPGTGGIGEIASSGGSPNRYAGAAARHTGPRRARRHREVPVAVGVFVVVLLTLQVFLLTVGLDALLADDEGLAWVTAGFSALLAAGAAGFYRYLR